MPPFGKRWFRVLRELDHDHPIALLRLHWMMLNMGEDHRLEMERRREEIEYGGFFANPEVYAHMKGHAKKSPFQVVQDTSEYDRKMDMAARGEVPVGRRRTDVAALVARKRIEAQAQQRPTRPVAALGPDDDDLIIEG
jgi:hypothetical protein